MFENLLNLVKEHAGDAIINNPAIPNERNNEAISTASDSIIGGLKDAFAGGQLNDVVQLFSNSSNATSSPLTKGIEGNLVQSLMGKFGLQNSQANGIASSLIPLVLNKLVHKTNDPKDSSFDIQGILGTITGGNTGGLDIGNIINQFKGGSEQQQQNGGGGIMDSLKGLFGN